MLGQSRDDPMHIGAHRHEKQKAVIAEEDAKLGFCPVDPNIGQDEPRRFVLTVECDVQLLADRAPRPICGDDPPRRTLLAVVETRHATGSVLLEPAQGLTPTDIDAPFGERVTQDGFGPGLRQSQDELVRRVDVLERQPRQFFLGVGHARRADPNPLVEERSGDAQTAQHLERRRVNRQGLRSVRAMRFRVDDHHVVPKTRQPQSRGQPNRAGSHDEKVGVQASTMS